MKVIITIALTSITFFLTIFEVKQFKAEEQLHKAVKKEQMQIKKENLDEKAK